MDIASILVPVDFSDHSRAALTAAIGLAQHFDAEIHLLHCHGASLGMAAPFAALLPSDYQGQVKRIARDMLEQQRDEVAARGVAVHSHQRTETPAEGIAKAAEQLSADLIVMGTHGRDGLEHALLGSVTEQTLRHARCPVLTVRADTRID